MSNYWLDNQELCLEDQPASPEITFRNGKVISSGCIGMYNYNFRKFPIISKKALNPIVQGQFDMAFKLNYII